MGSIMSTRLFKHRGQLGSIDFDLETKRLFGKLMFIDDLVTYEAHNLEDLEQEFKISVDEYLADCEELGVEANKPFKGSFNVRVGSELHRKIAFQAAESGIGLNEYVIKALEESLRDGVVRHEHKHTHIVTGSSTFEVKPAEKPATDWTLTTIAGWSSDKSKAGSCH